MTYYLRCSDCDYGAAFEALNDREYNRGMDSATNAILEHRALIHGDH